MPTTRELIYERGAVLLVAGRARIGQDDAPAPRGLGPGRRGARLRRRAPRHAEPGRGRAAGNRAAPVRAPRALVRVVRAVLGPGDAVVVHESGTRPRVRRALARLAARAGRPCHAVFLDVDPRVAAARPERARAAAGVRTRDGAARAVLARAPLSPARRRRAAVRRLRVRPRARPRDRGAASSGSASARARRAAAGGRSRRSTRPWRRAATGWLGMSRIRMPRSASRARSRRPGSSARQVTSVVFPRGRTSCPASASAVGERRGETRRARVHRVPARGGEGVVRRERRGAPARSPARRVVAARIGLQPRGEPGVRARRGSGRWARAGRRAPARRDRPTASPCRRARTSTSVRTPRRTRSPARAPGRAPRPIPCAPSSSTGTSRSASAAGATSPVAQCTCEQATSRVARPDLLGDARERHLADGHAALRDRRGRAGRAARGARARR